MPASIETPVTLRSQLSIRQSGTHADIRIFDPTLQDPIELRGATDWKALTGLGQHIADRLSKTFEGRRMGLKLSPKARDDLLERLRAIGVVMWAKVLGRYRSQNLRIGPGTLDRTAVLSVELTCPNDLILPVELLPILEPVPGAYEGAAALDMTPCPKSETHREHSRPSKFSRSSSAPAHDGVSQKAAALVGFGAEAQRSVTVSGIPESDSALDATTLCFYWDARLGGAKHELKALTTRFGEGLLGPNPQSRTITRSDLARQVIETPRLGSGLRSAIEHFSCHHVRGSNASHQDIIWLRSRGLRAKRIPIYADDLSEASLGKPAKSGLVVLNACGTHTISPGAVSSVVQELHQCGRTAIVATWCDVPDLVAAKMGDYFYAALFGGATVGEALRAARLCLLYSYNNPLGLLYTVYGDADYRVVG